MAILKPLFSAVAEILNGNPKFWGAVTAQGHACFCFGRDIIMGLVKVERNANFEVSSCSHCRYIKREPRILGSCHSLGARPLFLQILRWALEKPQLRANFEVANFSRRRNIKGKPQTLGTAPSHDHFFYWVKFYDGTWLTPK